MPLCALVGLTREEAWRRYAWSLLVGADFFFSATLVRGLGFWLRLADAGREELIRISGSGLAGSGLA